MTGDLLTPPEEFQEETLDNVLVRYSGFGKDLYRLLQEKLPQVFSNLRFYQWTTHQSEDSYAVYLDPDNPRESFAIQLDPLCEVIVIWNLNIHTEIGTWSQDPELESIVFIQEEFKV